MALQAPHLGHGVGLRPRHFPRFLEGRPEVDWVEAISENFMGVGGRPLAVLERVRRDIPVVLHGVSLSIGSVDKLDTEYLAQLKDLVERIQPALVSDHLCWGVHRGRYVHDLWPLPFTEEALAHVAGRVAEVQDILGRQLLLENVSSYLTYAESTLTEWEFLAEVAERAECGILLDVNNVHVSARNHGFSAHAFLAGIPPARVGQIHLAGHLDTGNLLLDTHDREVSDEVWALYREAIRRFGPTSTLIEWDEGVPEWERLVEESRKAAGVEREALAARNGERRFVSQPPHPVPLPGGEGSGAP
ncbi:MAG: DUF692 domain-containing protein [Myxococcaceae bacterium]|nr:DUF692 domain-containing protein [Myxococcaceae bacterium]MCI0670389.1 DUF692 domain-containing protein [Myxococcaceae bacterium]